MNVDINSYKQINVLCLYVSSVGVTLQRTFNEINLENYNISDFRIESDSFLTATSKYE